VAAMEPLRGLRSISSINRIVGQNHRAAVVENGPGYLCPPSRPIQYLIQQNHLPGRPPPSITPSFDARRYTAAPLKLATFSIET
jgi:hypothetical protein